MQSSRGFLCLPVFVFFLLLLLLLLLLLYFFFFFFYHYLLCKNHQNHDNTNRFRYTKPG